MGYVVFEGRLEVRYKVQNNRDADVFKSTVKNLANGQLHRLSIRRVSASLSFQVKWIFYYFLMQNKIRYVLKTLHYSNPLRPNNYCNGVFAQYCDLCIFIASLFASLLFRVLCLGELTDSLDVFKNVFADGVKSLRSRGKCSIMEDLMCRKIFY